MFSKIKISKSSNVSKNKWFIYIIKDKNNCFYTGITTDLSRRFAEHSAQNNKTAKYLRGKLPIKLVYWQEVADRSVASKLEAKIKKLSKTQKQQLITDTKLALHRP